MKRTCHDESEDERDSSCKKVDRETLEADDAVALLWDIIEEEIPKWLPSLRDLLCLSQTCKRLATRHLVKEIRGPVGWDNLVKFPALRTIKQFQQHRPDTVGAPMILDKVPATWTQTLKTLKLATRFHIDRTLAGTAFAGLETLGLRRCVTIDSDALALLTSLKKLEDYSSTDDVSGIQALTQLTSLSCERMKITGACLAPLVNLQFLGMDSLPMNMSFLNCQQSLRTLYLIRCNLHGHVDLSGCHNLTELDIESCSHARNIADCQLALPPSLKKFTLIWTCFPNGIEALYNTPGLQHFFFHHTGDQTSGRSDFYGVLRSLGHLEYLRINDECGIIQADALDHATRLKSLHLCCPKLPQDFHISQLTTLKELFLDFYRGNLRSQDVYPLRQLEKFNVLVPRCDWDASAANIEELSLALPKACVTSFSH